jgi:hypothetical protein
MKYITLPHSRLCTVPGCPNYRWSGPRGSNHKLTMCEAHQREDWRLAKERKRANAPKERKLRTTKKAQPPPTEAEKRTLVVNQQPSLDRRLVRVVHPEPEVLSVSVDVRTPASPPPERLLVIDKRNNHYTLFDVMKVRQLPEISEAGITDMLAIFGDMRVIVAEVKEVKG